MGALAITGVDALKAPFEPLTPGTSHVMNTNRFRHALEDDEAAFMKLTTDAIEQQILAEGPETVAAVYLEPVQNAGGCFVPPAGYFQRARDLRPVRRAARLGRGHLRSADSATCSAASATTTCRTSSPPRRASPVATRPWVR